MSSSRSDDDVEGTIWRSPSQWTFALRCFTVLLRLQDSRPPAELQESGAARATTEAPDQFEIDQYGVAEEGRGGGESKLFK